MVKGEPCYSWRGLFLSIPGLLVFTLMKKPSLKILLIAKDSTSRNISINIHPNSFLCTTIASIIADCLIINFRNQNAC